MKGSPRQKLSHAAAAADSLASSSRNRQEEFGSAISIGGTAGGDSVDLQGVLAATQSQAESTLTGGGTSDTQTRSSCDLNKRGGNVSYSEDDSAILWSEDPEKEYFEYALQQEQQRRAQQGKSAVDSLIGDSTVGEIKKYGRLQPSRGDQETISTLGDFPILSGVHHGGIVSAPPSTFGGYSLTSTEKSGPGEYQPRKPLPPLANFRQFATSEGIPHTPKGILPNTIFLKDAPSTIASKSTDGSTEQAAPTRKPLCFYVIVILLFGVVIAGSTLAIYLATSRSGVLTNSAESGLGNSGPTLFSTGIPSPFPTEPFSRKTHEPSMQVLDVDGEDILRGATSIVPSPSPSLKLERKTHEPTYQVTTGEDESETGMGETGYDWDIELGNISTGAPDDAPASSSSEVPSPAAPDTKPELDVNCGCAECTAVEMLQLVEGKTCRAHVDYLKLQIGWSEEASCRQIAGRDHPEECSEAKCNPETCVRDQLDTIVVIQEQPITDTREPTRSPVTSPRPSFRPSGTQRPTLHPVLQRPLPTMTVPTAPRPTPQPTPRPTLRPNTQRPTRRPTVAPTHLDLRLGDVFPLNRCEGDCDSDNQCKEGLVCFQRGQFDRVPGCLGGGVEDSYTDFCIPEEHTHFPTWNPTSGSTWEPTYESTWEPVLIHADDPQVSATQNPTSYPTENPTEQPATKPTRAPTTKKPTRLPSQAPHTLAPTVEPTESPISKVKPTKLTLIPSIHPTTAGPTMKPSKSPTTKKPTVLPSQSPHRGEPAKAQEGKQPKQVSEPSQAPISPDPTPEPSLAPTTPEPTEKPTKAPTTKKPSPVSKPDEEEPTNNQDNFDDKDKEVGKDDDKDERKTDDKVNDDDEEDFIDQAADVACHLTGYFCG